MRRQSSQAPEWNVGPRTGAPEVEHRIVEVHKAGFRSLPLYGRGSSSATVALDGCQLAARTGVPVCALVDDGVKHLERIVGDGRPRADRPRHDFWGLLAYLMPVTFAPTTMFARGIAESTHVADVDADALIAVEDFDGNGRSLLVYGVHSIRAQPDAASTR